MAVRIARHRPGAAVGHVDRREDARAVVLAEVLPQTCVEHGNGDALAGDAGPLQQIGADQHGIVRLVEQPQGIHAGAVLKRSRVAQRLHQRRGQHAHERRRQYSGEHRCRDVTGGGSDQRVAGKRRVQIVRRAFEQVAQIETAGLHVPIGEHAHRGHVLERGPLYRRQVCGNRIDDGKVLLDISAELPHLARSGVRRSRLYDVQRCQRTHHQRCRRLRGHSGCNGREGAGNCEQDGGKTTNAHGVLEKDGACEKSVAIASQKRIRPLRNGSLTPHIRA